MSKNKTNDSSNGVLVELRRVFVHLQHRPLFGVPTVARAPLLSDVSGSFAAGALCCVLGASGSGKTTLLNLLVQRLPTSCSVQGFVTYNKSEVPPLSRFGFVSQFDFFLPLLTVRETLMFGARLRMPVCTRASRANAVEALISDLSLKDCAATRVGGSGCRGISGGETRRLSVAVAMLRSPALLLADEPTTGLDAWMALSLVESLRNIANAGRTVIATLHQPRAEAFSLFDSLLLLARGQIVYWGSARAAMSYLSSLGFACPLLTSPPDFLLDLTSTNIFSFTEEEAAQADATHDLLIAEWAKRPCPIDIGDHTATGMGAFNSTESVLAVSFLTQISALLHRGLLNTLRDQLTLVGLAGGSIILGLVVGAIFFRLGVSPTATQERLTLAYISSSMLSYQFLVFFIFQLVGEIPIFEAERSDGLYSVAAWMSARVAVLTPQAILFPSCYSLIIYYMAGLRQGGAHAAIFLASSIACIFVVWSLALLAVSAQRTFSLASLAANSAYTFLGLSCGLLVQLRTLPIWLSWLQSISFLGFSFRILTVNELADREWTCSDGAAGTAACSYASGNFVLASVGVHPSTAAPAVGLVLSFVVLLVAAYGVLLWRPIIAARFATARTQPAPPRPVRRAATVAVSSSSVRIPRWAPPPANATVVPVPAPLSFRAFQPVTVRLHQLGLALNRPTRAALFRATPAASKQLLSKITLSLRPGELTLLYGASGSGKTSLLHVVGCRLATASLYTVTGDISYNGVTSPPRPLIRAIVGFVPQSDALLPLLTVTETLSVAASLRLSSADGFTPSARSDRVSAIVSDLGLRHVASSAVGSPHAGDAAAAAGGASASRGLSGGERRRLSVACALVTDPSVALLDEPTSGLDAAAALSLGRLLRRLANDGRTVAASLHCPREGLHALASRVVLLAGGRLVFSGPPDAMEAFLSAHTAPRPLYCNPADWAIDCASIDTRSRAAEERSKARVAALVTAFEAVVASSEEGDDAALTAGLQSSARPPAFVLVAFPILIRRSALNLARQPGVLAARLAQSISFAVILACFYARLGTAQTSILNRIGLMYEIMAMIFVGMLNAVATFPAERNLFYREAADGAYSTCSFLLSYTCLEVPCEIASALVCAVFLSPITGFKSDAQSFFLLAYVIFCIISAGESVGITTLSIIFHVGFSVSLVNVGLSILTVAAGQFAPSMPYFLKVLIYASPLRYAANALASQELAGLRFTCDTPGGCAVQTGEQMLALYQFHPDNRERDIGLLALVTVLFRLIAGTALHLCRNKHMG